MANEPFKITVHMVSSLDGYVAKKDNSISWFETADSYGNGVHITDEDAKKFLDDIDCYIMGSGTYEHALELSRSYGWAYGDKPTIVITNRKLRIERQNVETYSGDLNQLVNERLKPNYQNVWLAGGAKLAKSFINLNLADEIRQSILPVILGDGILFYDQIDKGLALHLKNVTAYKNGMVELHYEIKK
ncbi:MAG TPA: dihydrofolate reductase family protein [Mucilaginibacter sp.]|nr:dihydrofolate reductase family protein [Mucilaginibacter sp.]